MRAKFIFDVQPYLKDTPWLHSHLPIPQQLAINPKRSALPTGGCYQNLLSCCSYNLPFPKGKIPFIIPSFHYSPLHKWGLCVGGVDARVASAQRAFPARCQPRPQNTQLSC